MIGMFGVLEEQEEKELALKLKDDWEEIEARVFLPIIAFEPETLKARILDFRTDLDKLVNCVGV